MLACDSLLNSEDCFRLTVIQQTLVTLHSNTAQSIQAICARTLTATSGSAYHHMEPYLALLR